ncbi:hypothetical protein [Streptomyces sp. NPDC057694]|uniref:hypothetical protein n=1 Tax=Streptomyces sp. NPDC057694 TaxID=3346216 RepID=UPI0036B31898
MSDTQPESAGVQDRYAARVDADLETNRKEQERVSADVAALQQQLHALENDHAVLLNMQQALSSPTTPAAATKATPHKKAPARKEVVPAPRAGTKTSGAARAKKATAAKDKTAQGASKAAAKKPAAPATGPTLVELVEGHLGRQSEPRSAAEITTALAQAHPERTIKTTVVRTTVEGLVAKHRAQRTKQGSSVFYTATAPTGQAAAAPQPEPSAG